MQANVLIVVHMADDLDVFGWITVQKYFKRVRRNKLHQNLLAWSTIWKQYKINKLPCWPHVAFNDHANIVTSVKISGKLTWHYITCHVWC